MKMTMKTNKDGQRDALRISLGVLASWRSPVRSTPRAIKLIAPALLLLIAAGCAAKGRAGIPVEAERVASGKGEVIYKATDGGEAFVHDASDNKIIWSGFLRDGETLTIAPQDDRVAVGLQTVAEPDLDKDHKYTVYLRRD